jgi:hypothetical protein
MRNTSLCALLLILTIGATGYGQRLGPSALVVEPDFDFGYMPQYTKVSHTYWVDNLGTDTLRIFNIAPGCGCTRAPLTDYKAAPNDSLAIELVFDAGRRHREQNKGTKVSCNDPAMSLFNLNLRAWVYKDDDTTGPLQITKNEQLQLTTDDEGKSFDVEFRNISGQSLAVSVVDLPDELLSVIVPDEQVRPGETSRIGIKLNPDLRKVDYFKSVTFEVSDSLQTRYTIPVEVKVPVSEY